MRSTVWYSFSGKPPPTSRGTEVVTCWKTGVLGLAVANAKNALVAALGVCLKFAAPKAVTTDEAEIVGPSVPATVYGAKKARVAGAAALMNAAVGTHEIIVPPLRTRIHSVLLKKKSEFLLIGPPTE